MTSHQAWTLLKESVNEYFHYVERFAADPQDFEAFRLERFYFLRCNALDHMHRTLRAKEQEA